ncbi:MAG: ABC transporter ATP-binding protein [Anaerolineae bacterium]|nr:ABC transporter ATP-binding protein [Anaerolineae bacterium]
MFHGPGPGGGFRRLGGIEEAKTHDTRRTLRRLSAYLRPFWGQLALVMALITTTALLQLASPYLIGRAVDQFIIVGDRPGLARTVLLLLAVYLVDWVTMGRSFYLMSAMGQRILLRMRTQIFERIQSLSLSFFDQHEAGDLMSRLVNDVQVIAQVFNVGIVQLLGNVLLLAGIVIAMLGLNARLALASFTVLPAMFVIAFVFSQRARTAFRRTRETIGQVSAELEEKIAAVREVQAFGRQEENQARFAELSAADRDANVQAVSVTAAFSPSLNVLSSIAIAIVAGYGGYLVLRGQVTVGLIVSFLAYVRNFFQPIQSLAQLWATLQAALAGAERVFDLIDTQPDLVDAPDAVEMPPIVGRVVFDHVSFAYQSEEPVLEDVSLVAEPGQTVALVGVTGAGKTTLVNLLGRFYEVKEGSITIDGYDVRKVTQASLRRQMGVVLQDTFLFSGSVADNIRYGRLEATDEEVIAAAKLAGADDFISRLPEGYQTKLGEQGRNLSQGQRQLIAIARAILADPRILILDEATSSVDTRTERLIQAALEKLLRGRTSFVVAHRLSTIRNADQVLVINDGRIVERGTHEELLAAGGIYHNLYMSQFRRETCNLEPETTAAAGTPAPARHMDRSVPAPGNG